MSPNNGILLNDVLNPKLLNIPFVFCSFINLDFLLLHTARFGNYTVLPLLVFVTYDNMFYNGLCLIYEKFSINSVPTTFFIRLLFENLDFLDIQLAYFDTGLIILFVIITFSEPILLVCSLLLTT